VSTFLPDQASSVTPMNGQNHSKRSWSWTLFQLAAAGTAGFFVAKYQREIFRGAVKGGLSFGSKLRELQDEIAATIEDQVAEVEAQSPQK
jgi:hypothetical protein